MHIVLQFPVKVFVHWGAIAQEIVPYLLRRGVKWDEIPVVLERIRMKWAQLDQALPDISYVSRHWRSQSARMLIESSMDDYQRHVGR